MVEWDWFEEDPEDDLSEPQRAFLAALRVRARSWACTPDHTQLVEPGWPGDEWCALMDVSTKASARVGNGCILVTIAVAFDGASVHGGEVHNQNYHFLSHLESRVDPLPLGTGTPEHLAGIAADWFEQIMARPLLLHEWDRHGRTYCRYAFADTGAEISGNWFLGNVTGPPDRVVQARGVFPD
jgi:hypothetical protein